MSKFKFKSKLSLSLSLSYVTLSQSLSLIKLKSKPTPTSTNVKLFTYLLILAKNRNVTALFTLIPKSRPGPNTVYSLKYLPSKPENVTRAETEGGPPTSKKMLVFT